MIHRHDPRAAVMAMAALVMIAAVPAAAVASGQREEKQPQAVAAGDKDARVALRQALHDFYIRELTRELLLSPERAAGVAARVDALLDAHRIAGRDRAAAVVALRGAVAGERDPAAALEALASAENHGRARVSKARQQLLAELSPREQALFLGFEAPFRQRVRALMSSGEASARPAPAQARAERRAEGAAGPRRFQDGPRNSPDGPRNSGEPQRAEGSRDGARLQDTLRLLFTHELRLRLELDDARTLAILPSVDAMLDARQAGDAARRESLERLRVRAAEESAPATELAALVKAALDADAAASASLATSRDAILAKLSPAEGCEFILLEQRFLADARQAMARAWRVRGRSAEGAVRAR